MWQNCPFIALNQDSRPLSAFAPSPRGSVCCSLAQPLRSPFESVVLEARVVQSSHFGHQPESRRQRGVFCIVLWSWLLRSSTVPFSLVYQDRCHFHSRVVLATTWTRFREAASSTLPCSSTIAHGFAICPHSKSHAVVWLESVATHRSPNCSLRGSVFRV